MWISQDGKWKVEKEANNKFAFFKWSELLGDWTRQGHSNSLPKLLGTINAGTLTRVEIPDTIPDPWPSKN